MSDSMEPEKTSITEDEAALYDRQIRLWGLEAQERMRNATILVINLKGVAAETVKNIVLAGIGKLLLFDSELVSEEDLGAGFLFREEDVGKKRVDAARPNIEALNPLVSVHTFSEQEVFSEDALSTLLSGVDLVCVTDSTRDELIRYNEACRKSQTMFYAGGSYGLQGYIFVDLLTHQYVAPDRSHKPQPGTQPKMVRQALTYPSLHDALSTLRRTFSVMTKRQTKDINPLNFFSILAVWEYQSRHQGDLPDPENTSSVDELEAVANELIEKAGVHSQVLKSIPRLTIDTLAQTVAHEFSPACAVIGGLLAQDLLKALSAREPPYANFLTFDGVTGSGTVVKLGMN
ncbi:hypothetical protein FRB99_005344 [Tulasnella sp. 403]|nr:hypothetical protein FRB99_005344 [Tulasnella sp. 403]